MIIIPTKISFQTWSGGSGCNDPRFLIGYCKESPFDVLKKVILTHNIYHYNELYRPVDDNCPNNVEGLIIEEFNDNNLGITVTGVFEDLNLTKAITHSNRTKETISDSLSKCKKWHTYEYNKSLEEQCCADIDMIQNYIEETMK